MATYESVTYNSPDGAQVGTTSTELIAFFGATPVVQPSGASQGAVSTAAATTGAAIYGFTSAQAASLVALVNKMRADLVTLGLIKGS